MTPKEKAEELIRKYYRWGLHKDGQSLSWLESKECALIAVDEIIEVLWKTNKNETEYRHWQEVKKEIENL
jgi:2-hydroxy-3-keto-5-methylthiopentenyl-1-phosphate phosphatase